MKVLKVDLKTMFFVDIKNSNTNLPKKNQKFTDQFLFRKLLYNMQLKNNIKKSSVNLFYQIKITETYGLKTHRFEKVNKICIEKIL